MSLALGLLVGFAAGYVFRPVRRIVRLWYVRWILYPCVRASTFRILLNHESPHFHAAKRTMSQFAREDPVAPNRWEFRLSSLVDHCGMYIGISCQEGVPRTKPTDLLEQAPLKGETFRWLVSKHKTNRPVLTFADSKRVPDATAARQLGFGSFVVATCQSFEEAATLEGLLQSAFMNRPLGKRLWRQTTPSSKAIKKGQILPVHVFVTWSPLLPGHLLHNSLFINS